MDCQLKEKHRSIKIASPASQGDQSATYKRGKPLKKKKYKKG
jgi:hypothetical protein